MGSDHRPATFLLLLLFPLLLPAAEPLGVNWGTASSHPLPPAKVVAGLLRANNISKVKLADANAEALASLSGSGVAVTVGIPNEMLKTLNSSKKAAESWVHDNITRYFPTGGVRIEYIAVGDEPFLFSYGQQFQPYVIGAAMNIQQALLNAKLADKVKVIVPCSSDVFESNSTVVIKANATSNSTSNTTSNSSEAISLPSGGHFRTDINRTMSELLFFLSKQDSPFVVNINPLSTFQQSKNVSLDYFLFRPKSHSIRDGNIKYTNFFDVTIDTLVASLTKAGHGNMEIIVGKIGWPTDGTINATSAVARTFIQGLFDHLKSKAGTPFRPKRPPSETYIYSLLDEDQRSITTGNFERHWGVFTFDGQAKYNLDLGQGSSQLINARDVEYLPSKWCVVNDNKDDLSNISASFAYACSNADCTALSPGSSCYGVSWPGNVSYAFNSYYQQHDQRGDSCDFGGLGLITTVDPSVGDCRFAVALQTSSSLSQGGYRLMWRAIFLSLSALLSFTFFQPS